MEYKEIEKKDFTGKKVKILGESYDPGTPECIGSGEYLGWRAKFKTKEDKLKYLKSAERYWYSKDWFGSEKPK